MASPQYHFHSTWRIAAHPAAVFAVLPALDDYPSWWPQVRRGEAGLRARLHGVAANNL